MVQADYRQLGFSTELKFVAFNLCSGQHQILLPFFRDSPKHKIRAGLHQTVRCPNWPDIGNCGLVPSKNMRSYQAEYGTFQWVRRAGQ